MKYAKQTFCMMFLAVVLSPSAGFAQNVVDFSAAAPLTASPSAGKYLHVLAGMAVGLTAAALTQDFNDPSAFTGQALVLPAVALGAAAVAGIAKELLDSTGFGDPRFTDILITMSGGLVAAGSLLYTQSIYPQTSSGRINSSLFYFATALLLAIPVGAGFITEINRFIERRSAPRNP